MHQVTRIQFSILSVIIGVFAFTNAYSTNYTIDNQSDQDLGTVTVHLSDNTTKQVDIDAFEQQNIGIGSSTVISVTINDQTVLQGTTVTVYPASGLSVSVNVQQGIVVILDDDCGRS